MLYICLNIYRVIWTMEHDHPYYEKTDQSPFCRLYTISRNHETFKHWPLVQPWVSQQHPQTGQCAPNTKMQPLPHHEVSIVTPDQTSPAQSAYRVDHAVWLSTQIRRNQSELCGLSSRKRVLIEKFENLKVLLLDTVFKFSNYELPWKTIMEYIRMISPPPPWSQCPLSSLTTFLTDIFQLSTFDVSLNIHLTHPNATY